MTAARRDFLKTMASGVALGAGPAARTSQPNILIIMADQQRAGLTRGSGYALDTMPALDRLCASGASFARAYTTAPLCVPARVSLLTGRWPHAHRVRQNSAAKFASFSQDLFDIARGQGYRIGLAGKNHSHLTPAKADFWRPYSHLDGYRAPNAPREFAEFDAWMKRLNHGTGAQATPFPVETQYPHRIVSDALEFIGAAGEQPFALWVSFPEPHNPYQVPKPYFDLFPPETIPARGAGPEALRAKGFKWEWLRRLEEQTYPGYDETWRRTRSVYLGMLRMIDDQVARLLGGLESRGVMQDTLVVYLSDHGDYFCDYGLVRKGAGLPEALVRIPFCFAGWGVRQQADPGAFVSTADIMPTLCEAVGAAIPPGAQGRSLWPLLQGKPYPREEFASVYSEVGFGGMDYGPGDDIPDNWGRVAGGPGATPTFDELNPVTQSGSLKMVRAGDWKLTCDGLGRRELYNLAADPYELANLSGQPRAAAMEQQLTAALLRWTVRTEDDLPVAAYRHKWPARNWRA